jgi:opacity protein-like surface antigen
MEALMKKLVLVLVLAILMAGAAFADHPSGFGIGVQGGGGGNWSGGGFGSANTALTLKFPSVPIFWAIRADIWKDYFGLGVSGDFYFIDSEIAPSIGLNWYLGFGLGVGLWGFNDNLGLGVSARLPIGLSWQPIDLLEIYLQVVPNLGVQILPDVHFPYGGWGGDIGIRFWF